MELKDYQRSVINDLVNFLEYLETYKTTSMAFREYWNDRGASKMENYKENIKGVPHVCIKVPTAGGKTFLAANALKPILDTVNPESTGQPKVVIWLVPSLIILEQTARNFSDPSHPYRQRLNTHFNGRVEIYDKQSLLQGTGFSPDAIQGQLTLILLSFDSLRARNKDDRKIFQENGNLATFEVTDEDILGNADPTALINIIRALKPVLIVDESHNAESDLSVEMLKNLNPSFILDLTATPRNNSNIISFVDALALKKESMVKLPVIVYNRTDKTDVVNTALQLRNKLEKLAIAEEKVTGKYIRPIVLFQAEPKTNDDKETFLKIKETLLKLKIPKEQIAIKTSGINELMNVDLMSSGCHVRYIITVNALKEGWDCPFAYILASLADKSSVVDVEQVVGRVLRQPYVVSHKEQLLNMSYVLTASNRFRETLDKVVKGLNRAGFSDRDYRVVEDVVDQKKPSDIHPELELKVPPIDPVHPAVEPEADDIGIDIARIKHSDTEADQATPDAPTKDDTLAELTVHAEEANAEFTKKAQDAKSSLSPDLESRMNKYPIKEIFFDEAKAIRIPQFFIRLPAGGFFEEAEKLALLEKENLLQAFRLNTCDTAINFTGVDVEAYQIDLEETGKEDSRPSYKKIDPRKKERLNQYILTLPRESQVKNLSDRIASLVGNMFPIPDKDVKDYVLRILGGLTPEQLYDCLERDYSYTKLIKDKIKELATEYAEKIFMDWLVTGKIVAQSHFSLQDFISPSLTGPAIPKSLYMSEKKSNGFEERVINEVANLPNIRFWHKNFDQGQTSFKINGFINHYPDFIVKTESGKIVLIETKGDDRDNSDSARKVKLGRAWVQQAGKDFKYFMVFDKNPLEGAYRLADFLELLRDI